MCKYVCIMKTTNITGLAKTHQVVIQFLTHFRPLNALNFKNNFVVIVWKFAY